MTLKAKLYIFMSALFVIFSTLIWIYSGMLFDNMNEEWGKRFVKKQMTFDKNRTLLPILHELSTVEAMAHDPLILAMAKDDTNETARKAGLKAFEKYRMRLQNHIYFAGFADSRNYYFNDANGTYTGAELRYQLSSSNSNDEWFFKALHQDQDFSLNVDADTAMGHTKLWINYVIKDDQHVLGVIGTGFDLDRFISESVGVEQEGVLNYLVDRNGGIQLAREATLMDYAGITTQEGQHKKIDTLFTKDAFRVYEAMNELSMYPSRFKTLWVDAFGKKQLLGIMYIPEIHWYSLTLIDAKELQLFKDFTIFPMLSALFLLALIIVGIELNSLILSPLNKLKEAMRAVEQGQYEVELCLIGTAEISDLAQQFRTMIRYVRATNEALEQKVQERTKTLTQNEQKLNTILNTVDAYIYIKDEAYRYVYANQKMCELLRDSFENIVGKDDEAFFDQMTVDAMRKLDQQVIEFGRQIVQQEITTVHHDIMQVFLTTKMPLFRDDGSVYALCGIATDITERKQNEEVMKGLAFHDTLTQLPNRRFFDERFGVIIQQSVKAYKYGALMMIDLDNFKPLNDEYGHQAGDLLLVEAARRLGHCIRKSDIAARFGGDEFVVAIGAMDENHIVSFQEAQKIAFKILVQLGRPYIITVMDEVNHREQTIEHRCTASIGVTLFGSHKQDKELIFKEADQAMYEAKQKGRNRIEFFEEYQR